MYISLTEIKILKEKIVRSNMAKIQSKSDTEVKGKVLTPEGDKRVDMGEEGEESTTEWGCGMAPEESKGEPPPLGQWGGPNNH